MTYSKKRSRESRAAIERIYINMRQLILRGSFKPNGVNGKALMDALQYLEPEIYGSINDPHKSELAGLLYVAERLPKGIEECAIIKLVAREGYENSGHEVQVPSKRRRSCYRIDTDRMYVEMSRGRSDIYDILTHLTFLNIEAQKIMHHAIDHKGKITDNWRRLEEVVQLEQEGQEVDPARALVYLSNVLGRTPKETKRAVVKFASSKQVNSLYHFTYHLGRVAVRQQQGKMKKEVFFSEKLREVIGHHVYGEAWARQIKSYLRKQSWEKRPLYVISANLHSFLNAFYGMAAMGKKQFKDREALIAASSVDPEVSEKIAAFAQSKGFHTLLDQSGTNLDVQFFDLEAMPPELCRSWGFEAKAKDKALPLLLVMDYAFGEQAFECMDELLKPYSQQSKAPALAVEGVLIMGKAGILDGEKGDIMLPTAHVFEGTADNYPLNNAIQKADLEGAGLNVYEGTMVTVLGTSLQNTDVLHHFLTSTWNAVGIEMEGAHYQKAIQSASRIRMSIPADVPVAYAYYASDNPLKTGSTLSSGSLGKEGLKPTYLITDRFIELIRNWYHQR